MTSPPVSRPSSSRRHLQQKKEDWYHIAILGAGVAGLLTAIAVAQLHSAHDVVVIDHSRLVYPGSPSDDDEEDVDRRLRDETAARGLPSDQIWLNAHSLEILNRLDLLEEITQLAKPLHSVCVTSTDGNSRTLKRFLKSSSTKFASGIVIEQWKLERYLAHKLDSLHVDVHRFHAVTDVRVNCEDSRASAAEFPVTLTCREYKATSLTFQWADEPKTIMTKFVIGADGHHSIVRRALGIPMHTSATEPFEYMLADFMMAVDDTREGAANRGADDDWLNKIRIIHRHHGSGLIWPYAEPYRFRLMMRRRRQETPRTGSDIETNDHDDRDEMCAELSSRSITPISDQDANNGPQPLTITSFKKLNAANDDQLKHIASVIFGPGWVVKDILWKRAFAVNYEIAETVARLGEASDPVSSGAYGGILVGNAARGAPPLWSVGLNLAIEDAFQLGWRLVAVLENKAQCTLLSEDYNNLRIERTRKVFDVCANSIDDLLNADKIARSEKKAFHNRLFGGTVQKLFHILPDNILLRDLNEILTLGYEDLDMPGLSSIRLIGFHKSDKSAARVLELGECCKATSLKNHIFMMVLRVLQPGTRIKTIFGCERPELADRYHVPEVDALVALAHAMSVRLLDITHVWIFTPTAKPDNADVGDPGEAAKCVQRLPNDLLARIPESHLTYYDHDNEAYENLGLTFAEATSTTLSKQTCREELSQSVGAGFCLLTPDGRRVAKGLVGDKPAVMSLDAYIRRHSTKAGNL